MTDHGIAEDVRQLLHDHVTTYAELEILTRLTADCGRYWSVEELAGDLRLPVASVSEAVDHLRRTRLIHETVTAGRRAVGCPKDAPALPLLERLADAYDVNRLEVINLMNANAMGRVRTAAMRAFARAFLLRRKDD